MKKCTVEKLWVIICSYCLQTFVFFATEIMNKLVIKYCHQDNWSSHSVLNL